MMIKGYIALTSAIVISILIMTIVLAASFSGFFSRSNTSDSYFKEVTRTLAEGCVDMALVKLAADPLYSGNEIINIGSSDTCEIKPIEIDEPNLQNIIKTKASLNRIVTNLKVVAAQETLEIVMWEELESL